MILPTPLSPILTAMSLEQRLLQMRIMLKEAKALADDGNWAECYYDDVRLLLALLREVKA